MPFKIIWAKEFLHIFFDKSLTKNINRQIFSESTGVDEDISTSGRHLPPAGYRRRIHEQLPGQWDLPRPSEQRANPRPR